MRPNVWIVPVNFNGLEDTRKCLRSLESLTHPAETVVVDNASREDPTPALAREFPRAHLVRNSFNGGWSGGNNTGIRFAARCRDVPALSLPRGEGALPHLNSKIWRNIPGAMTDSGLI